MDYTLIENDTLPEDDRKSEELVLGKACYTMIERVLYRTLPAVLSHLYKVNLQI